MKNTQNNIKTSSDKNEIIADKVSAGEVCADKACANEIHTNKVPAIKVYAAAEAEGKSCGCAETHESKLDDLEIILQQATQIDAAAGESAESINTLLKSIGEYMNAGRAYIFEFFPEQNIFRNTYEWCGDGVKPAKDMLQGLAPEDMPVWYDKFRIGEKIIIENLSDIKEIMPLEYNILAPQDITSEIAFPIKNKDRLMGFIGVDNPGIHDSYRYINILSMVGWHLGAVWNMKNAEKLLNEKQEIIRQSTNALAKEKRFLETLCFDYTSVYYVDLDTGKTEAIEIDASSNAASFIARNYRVYNYETLLRHYVDNYVIKDTAKSLGELLDIQNLRRLLKDNERLVYRYRCKPNKDGHQYFETQVVRAKKDGESDGRSGRAMISFRHIDEIVAEEQRRQDELEKLLAEAKLNNEIISAISKIYVSIYRIDIAADRIDEIQKKENMHMLTGRSGSASKKMREICDTLVASEYRDRVAKFLDLSTLPERLRNEETAAIEYLAEDGNWHLARFIVKKRDGSGRVSNVLYLARIISDAKRREYNWIAIAEEANRENAAKTDFLSRMAHDIRTPMNAVMGYAAIARHNINDGEKVTESLNGIEKSGKYLQQIVDDVLDITRIESGNMKIFAEETNIRDMFEDCAETIKSTAEEKNLEISFSLHDIAHDILVMDPLRMKQVIINILSNAVKYTHDGGCINTEVFEEQIPGKNKVRLITIINDTGIGMTEEFMEHMYDKFSRSVDTRVNKVRGSGLGLAVVKELTELMGGTIEAKSRIGEGTEFRLGFEFEYSENAAGEALKKKCTKMNEVPHNVPDDCCMGMHLLLAEDNDLNFEVERTLLEYYGISCDRAENGAVCVEKLMSTPAGTYDAVLMDMQMPVMDGTEAAQAIRSLSDPEIRNIVIIALTANAFNADVRKCLDAGMNEHLSKPFDIERLLTVLSTYRRRR